MNMQVTEILKDIIYSIIVIVVPILSKHIISYIEAKREEKLEIIKNNEAESLISEALTIIESVVDKVSQTYVDKLKKEGVFSIDKQKEALSLAVNEVKLFMREDVEDLIIDTYNNLDEWIIVQIESYIKKSK